jgi:hypothetical protein
LKIQEVTFDNNERSVWHLSKLLDKCSRWYVFKGFTSFYHQKGPLKGHVKGSVKFLESIFLSLPSLDFFVGTDKVYGNRQETGNPFYTSLKPWNRNASDMGNFARFLEFWGWRL